ncbi:helix-turn-helix domain-containing protein [Curvivirga sp.]|uniref:helix-turn-helix domain-containing protein n=1 Tax=Curvivirga sp. TaxID=2856848 RepID=UPI003B597486
MGITAAGKTRIFDDSLNADEKLARSNPCADCTVRNLSFCNCLNNQELEELDAIVTHLEVPARAPIIDEKEPAEFLFNVTGGAVKLYKLLADGRRQITGFLFAGDFLGIAMKDNYVYSAESVNKTTLCRFRRTELEEMVDKHAKLSKQMLNMASNELEMAQEQMLLLGRKTAKEKLCSFLLTLSKRAEKRGEAATPIYVPMSRADIGDYLGLTTETVSRTFTNLKRDRVIRLQEGSMIHLNDLEELEDHSEGL